MLMYVFDELEKEGIVSKVDTSNYCSNIDKHNNSCSFVYSKCSFEQVQRELKEAQYTLVKYGFEGDTELRTLEVGTKFIDILNKHGFSSEMNEKVRTTRTVSFIITEDDLPCSPMVSLN